MIKRILHYCKGDFIPNREQYDEAKNKYIDFDQNKIVLQSFALSGFSIDKTLEELAKQTKLKVILSKDKSYFPYINIYNDKIENNLSATFKNNIPRDKAKNHLRALCENATNILICDKYIKNNFDNFKNFINECLPNKQINLFFTFGLDNARKSEIKTINNKYLIKNDRNNNYPTPSTHDRYILIDQKIEIILTSGIDYLYNTTKDFTYIIRVIQ